MRGLVPVVVLAVALALTYSKPLKELEKCKVHYVIDGDTFDCKVLKTNKEVRVRLLGIDTLEVRHGDEGHDECHGPQAEVVMRRLVLGKVVSLRATFKATSGHGRIARYVFVRRNGKWVDVGKTLLGMGHAVQFTRVKENPLAMTYNKVANYARKHGKNIWNKNFCGKGPAGKLSLGINFNKKNEPTNSEYVSVKNVGKGSVRLDGWVLRPMLHVNSFTFPKKTILKAGDTILVRSGRGKASRNTFYWPLIRKYTQLFPSPNPTTGYAPAVYLIDTKGNFRAWRVYSPRELESEWTGDEGSITTTAP
jgi:endonuclease YncB( thermonuclease family)